MMLDQRKTLIYQEQNAVSTRVFNRTMEHTSHSCKVCAEDTTSLLNRVTATAEPLPLQQPPSAWGQEHDRSMQSQQPG